MIQRVDPSLPRSSNFGIDRIHNLIPKPPSKNRPSRSMQVGHMFRALSTWVGKAPITLISMVNH